MKIHFFQHVPFEGLGALEPLFKKPGSSLTGTKFFEDHKLPFVDICDMLVVMGGPMGVHDESQYPWLHKEKKFIEQALQKGKKVLGVCLGAQLLADVLGAKVYKNQEKEIGWFDITKTAEGESLELLKDFNKTEKVFHWHGDTFELPGNAVNLFESAGCQNQAFLYKDQALGLQFHLELSESNILSLIENCGHELQENGPYIAPKAELVKPELMEKSHTLAYKLIQRFTNI